jgi:hypothetical protein
MSSAKQAKKCKASTPEPGTPARITLPAKSSKKSQKKGSRTDPAVVKVAAAVDTSEEQKRSEKAQRYTAKEQAQQVLAAFKIDAAPEATEVTISDGLVVVSEQRAAQLHCCRPAFFQPGGGGSWGLGSSGGALQEPVLLCGYGDGVRGAAVRTGAWLWALDDDSSSSPRLGSRALGTPAAALGDDAEAAAGNAGAVTAVACSADGVHVLVGTSSGKLLAFTHLGAWAAQRARRSASAGTQAGTQAEAQADDAGFKLGASGDSGFVLTGAADAGSPVLSLAAAPAGAKRLYAVLGPRLEAAEAAAVEAVAGDVKEKTAAGKDGVRNKLSGWKVAVVTVGEPKVSKKKGPGLRTALRVDSIFASRARIFGLALLPAPGAAAGALGGAAFSGTSSSASSASGVPTAPDVVLATSGGLVVLPADLRFPLPLASLSAEAAEALVAPPAPSPKHVPYADPRNPACCLAAQPLQQGSRRSLGVATGHAEGQIYVW